MEFPLDKNIKGYYLFKMKCYVILITVIALGISGCVANQGIAPSSEDELRREIKELRASVEASNTKLASLENEKRDIEDQKISLMLLKKELAKNIEAVKELKKSAYEIKEPADLKVVKLEEKATGGADNAGKRPAVSKKASPEKKKTATPVRVISKKKPPARASSAASAASLKSLKALTTEELYDKGLKLYNAENYSSARAAFTLLIEKSPKHKLADNALYWVAETYYAHTRYLKAVEVFNDVAKRYPDGNKTPDSLLKIGYSYLELENSVEAQKAFERLIELYPETQAADRARDRLIKKPFN